MHFVCQVGDGTDRPCQMPVSLCTSSPVTELINHTDAIKRCWFPCGPVCSPFWMHSSICCRMVSFTHHPVVKAVICAALLFELCFYRYLRLIKSLWRRTELQGPRLLLFKCHAKQIIFRLNFPPSFFSELGWFVSRLPASST